MKRKKINYQTLIFLCVIFLLLLFGYSCSVDGDNDYSVEDIIESQSVNDGKNVTIISKESAIETAEEWLESVCSFGDSNWTDSSEITAAYPVKTPGIDGTSYYECKITTNGEDAGYILVNINQTDMSVPEFRDEGATITEEYRSELGRNDFDVYRFDWFTNAAAEESDASRSTGDSDLNSRIIAQKGTYVGSDNISSYIEAAKEKGCMPYYGSEDIANYYGDSTASNNTTTRTSSDNMYGSGDMPSASSSAVLSGETAAWRQPYVDVVGLLGITNREEAACIGCGPTAWTVVYKYWQDNKGINFGLADSYEYKKKDTAYGAGDSNTAVECMIDLADLMDTFYSTDNDTDWGATLPAKMKRGIKYATQNGFSSSTVDRDSGTEASKFANVINYIGANKPVILYICSDGV
ncbi:MAG: hypothetical protein PQJ46_14210, partial [Spirochaetales bacterium]|nr:hypothetical protein [Spirochaetales bacterium]